MTIFRFSKSEFRTELQQLELTSKKYVKKCSSPLLKRWKIYNCSIFINFQHNVEVYFWQNVRVQLFKIKTFGLLFFQMKNVAKSELLLINSNFQSSLMTLSANIWLRNIRAKSLSMILSMSEKSCTNGNFVTKCS